MEPTLDEIREELAAIHDKLLALPEDDFAARSELRERQTQLRQRSYELAEGLPLHDKEALLAAYKRLEVVRDRMLEERLSVSGEGAGDAGIDNMFLNAINRAIDSGAGFDEVEARMAEIIQQLKSAD